MIRQVNLSKIKVKMQSMFEGAKLFNRDISTWNTSNVTDMEAMFHDACSFNGDLSNWDTSRVIHMSIMFCCATRLRIPLIVLLDATKCRRAWPCLATIRFQQNFAGFTTRMCHGAFADVFYKIVP